MSSLAQNIRARRKALGLTQAQLAGRLGIPQSCISRIERGRRDLTVTGTLPRWARALECAPADLLPAGRE